MIMKSNNKASNIHVFRINRGDKTKEVPISSTLPTHANSRKCLSAVTKRLICEDHIENPKSTQEVLAQKYGCKRTTIAKILKSKDRWLSIDSDTVTAKRYRQRSSRYPVVENAVVLWLQREHNSDITLVNDQMLRDQARQYAQEFHEEGSEEFKASSSWLLNFKQRFMDRKELNIDSATTPKDNVESASTDTPMSDVIHHATELNTSDTSTTPAAFKSPVTTSLPATFTSPIACTTSLTTIPPVTTISSIINNNQNESITSNNTANLTIEKETVSELAVFQPDSSPEVLTSSNRTSPIPPPVPDIDNIKSQTTYKKDDLMKESEEFQHQFGTEDHCDDMESPCFDNNDINASPRSTQEDNGINRNIDNNHNHKSTATTTSYTSTIIAEASNNTLQYETTKIQAKQHLEAALTFYNSQKSNPVSADMIKLILRSDF